MKTHHLLLLLTSLSQFFWQPMLAWGANHFEKISYACKDDQSAATMKQFFENTVDAGIEKLKKINPALADKAEAALSERSLAIICQCENLPTNGMPQPQGAYLGPNNPMGANIPAGAESICYNLNNLDQDVAQLMSGAPKPTSQVNADRGIVFHEVMHFSHFDNLDLQVHNQLPFTAVPDFQGNQGRRGPPTRRCQQSDIIYSCMWTLFPNRYGPICNSPEENVNFCTNFKP